MASITRRTNKAGEMSYLIRAFAGEDASGKQLVKSMTWKPPVGMKPSAAEKQAEKEAILFEEKVKSGVVTIDGNIKFADYAAKWLESAEIREKTMLVYNKRLKRINQAIGHIPLEKLRTEHIRQFIKNLREDGINETGGCVATEAFINKFKEMGVSCRALSMRDDIDLCARAIRHAVNRENVSPETADKLCAALGLKAEGMFIRSRKKLSDETIKTYYTAIRTILNSAKKSRIIPHNVAEFMDTPKVQSKEARYLDDEEAGRFFEAVLNEPDIRVKAVMTVLLFTGVRLGELCGLEWRDIDYKGMTINICRQSQKFTGRDVEAVQTKTKSSERSIAVPPIVMEVLKKYHQWWIEYRFKLGDTWEGKSANLFIQKTGKPMNPGNIGFWLNRFTDKNGLPRISPHSLRHTFITLQIAAGVDIRTLQARSGHSQASTLLNVYSHAIQSAQAKAAEAIENVLLSKNKKLS